MFDVKPLDISIIEHITDKAIKASDRQTSGIHRRCEYISFLKVQDESPEFLYFPDDCGKLFIQVYLLMTSSSNIEILMFCGMSGPSSHLYIMIMLHCVLT